MEPRDAVSVPSSAAGRLVCGVDVGASATKLILLDDRGEIRARSVLPSGVDYAETARSCLGQALATADADRSHIARTVSTGYGRRNVDFADTTLTEIHCHGIGCYSLLPHPMTIVDIGGQDNKVIRIDGHGRRVDFTMNRKCAAGTGAFIEEIALRLNLDTAEMDRLAAKTPNAVRLSSFCTVFAKTEILAHLRQGVAVEEIVRGAFVSVIQRVMEMAPLEGDIVLSGGVVAHNPIIATILSEQLGRTIEIAPHPQFTAALGAAISAARSSR